MAAKVRPLILRLQKDGKLYLDSDKFPVEHHFSLRWMFDNQAHCRMERAEDGTAMVILTLENGEATYAVKEVPSGNEPWVGKLKDATYG